MRTTICDVCGKIIKNNFYKQSIIRQKKEVKDATVWSTLYDDDLCQKCFLKLERERNRLRKLGGLND